MIEKIDSEIPAREFLSSTKITNGQSSYQKAKSNMKILQVIVVLITLLSISVYAQNDPSLCGSGYNTLVQGCIRDSTGLRGISAFAALICVAVFLLLASTKQGFFNRGENTAKVQNSTASPVSPMSSTSLQPQSVDIQHELQKAADMLKSGLIDDDEYKELKKKIISKS